MSAKKGAQTSSVVVGGAKKNRVGPRSRLTVLAVAGLVLVVVIGFGGWVLYQKVSDNDGQPGTSPSSKIPAAAQKMTDLNGKKITQTQRSQQAVYYGEYEQGQQLLKDQLGSAKSDDEKVTLYMQLSTNALNAKNYDEANEYAQEVLKIKKFAGAYSLLATIAAAQGNKAKAIEYANEQKKLLDPKSPVYQRNVDSINKFIEAQK